MRAVGAVWAVWAVRAVSAVRAVRAVHGLEPVKHCFSWRGRWKGGGKCERVGGEGSVGGQVRAVGVVGRCGR